MTPVVKRLDKNDVAFAKATYQAILQGDFPLKGKDIKNMHMLFSWLGDLEARIAETLKPLPVKPEPQVKFTQIDPPAVVVEEKKKKAK